MINNYKISFQSLFLVILFLSIYGCSSSEDKRLLPSAKGANGEVIVVMDDKLWNEDLGKSVKAALEYPVLGVLKKEPSFTIRHIKPFDFKGLLKEHKNLVVVTTFDLESPGNLLLQESFTGSSVEKIKSDNDIFYKVDRDVYAKGQIAIQLFSNKRKTLTNKIDDNASLIRKILDKEEMERHFMAFNDRLADPEFSKKLFDKHSFSFALLKGYQTVMDTTDFLWLRHPEAKVDKNLFFARRSYESESQFALSNVLSWRDELGKNYLFDPDDKTKYVITEMLEPPAEKEVSFQNKYAKEIRGIWKIKNAFTGGSFVSYIFVDTDTQTLYYIEGFVNAPGKDKREIIRELSAILNTFQVLD